MQLYQNIKIPGEDLVYEDPKRANSKFWNEGKWDNFIKPLLPKRRDTFIELGCNAGLFLKIAIDAGFKNVWGVDNSKRRIREATLYRDSNKYPYHILHRNIGKDFNVDELPVSDVILMANFHYYLPMGTFLKLVDSIRNKTRYCIIVSAGAKRRSGKAFYKYAHVRSYFEGWEEMKVIDNIDSKGDLTYREHMYGVLFKGGLKLIDINTYYKHCMSVCKRRGIEEGEDIGSCVVDFFSRVKKGNVVYKKTKLYRYWRKRRSGKGVAWVIAKLEAKEALFNDIRENGIKEPVLFDRKGKLLDGGHRVCAAKVLGYKNVLAKELFGWR